VIDYEIVVMDPEQFTNKVQILMCCWDVGLQWQARNRSTAYESKWRIDTTPCAWEIGGRTGAGALLSRSIGRTAISYGRTFFLTAVVKGRRGRKKNDESN
jgi:hypothetical protein